MCSQSIGKIRQVDELVGGAVHSAATLLATQGMAALAAASASSSLGGSVYASLQRHAEGVIAQGQDWSSQVAVIRLSLVEMADAAEALRNPRDDASVDALTTAIAAVTGSVDKIRSMEATIQRFNDGFDALVGELSQDSASVASTIQADNTQLADLQRQLADFHRSHSGAKYACEEVGKAIVSFGGWAIADAVNAQKAASNLNSEIGALQGELPALESLEHPVDALTNELASLVAASSNLVAAVEEVANGLGTIMQEAAKVHPDAFWFRAQLRTLASGLDRLLDLTRALASRKDVRGVYLFPRSLGIVWRDVNEADLAATFSPPQPPLQLNDVKLWSRAAARWGASQVQSGSETYLIGIPTFETNPSLPVRGVMLIPRSIGAVWRDVTDDELLTLFGGSLRREDLNNPRCWAAAINRYAIQQNFAMGLPTWESGWSNGRLFRGALMIPASSGIEFKDVPVAELALTFSPPLNQEALDDNRYWAASVARWSQAGSRSQRYGFAVPNWEVGSAPI